MGAIRAEVRAQHLDQYPGEEELLKAFLPGFFVTWARRRRAFNTELSVLFLNPESFITEAYGIEQEMMLVYSPFNKVEPRSIQAVESFFADDPAKGRVEKLVYFFISESDEVVEWFRQYSSENQESRLVIPLFADEVREHAHDAWYIRNQMNGHIYGRDLFDYRLPLERDISFFGRSDLVLSLHDSVKRSENRGIFGLRKTGKTSLLFKLDRMLAAEGTGHHFYYDCKLPSIRKLRWFELLGRICEDLKAAFRLTVSIQHDERYIDKSFGEIVRQLPGRTLLVFDEVEYISPVAIDDLHWHKDFVDFWQAFWAVQSRDRKICTLLAGVNPWVVEMDSIAGIQNPLFGIVSHQFLRGLDAEETRSMIRTLGRRMGLRFSPEAADYIFLRYGGHPLLTRIACSILNTIYLESSTTRPISVDRLSLLQNESKIDTDLAFYCRHVISELKQFYLGEYEMLELLASGQTLDFMELSKLSDSTKHLSAYGLMVHNSVGVPKLAIPVVGRYIAMELAKSKGRRTLLYVIPEAERSSWLKRRKSAIMHDFRLLETTFLARKKLPIYGPSSIPEADHFMAVSVVQNAADFERFINICNRCFVESTENYGKLLGKEKYYWTEVRECYPGIWQALQRIKIYRHEHFHLQLTAQASAELIEFLRQDLDGASVKSVDDGYFILQQCVLDSLLTGIQIETATLT